MVGHQHARCVPRLPHGHMAVRTIERRAAVHIGVTAAADHPDFRRRLREAMRWMARDAGQLAGGRAIAVRFEQAVSGAVQFKLVIARGGHSVRGFRTAGAGVTFEAYRLPRFAGPHRAVTADAADSRGMAAILARVTCQAFRRKLKCRRGCIMPAIPSQPRQRQFLPAAIRRAI